MLGDPLLVVGHIAKVLEHLEVRYVVGGSVASSVYGVPRATQDVGLVAELTASTSTDSWRCFHRISTWTQT